MSEMTTANLSQPSAWQRHAPAALVFSCTVLACTLASWLLGSARLIGPFIASAGVIAAAASEQRSTVIHQAVAAYVLCTALGLLGHALLPAGAAVQSVVAALGFVGLRLWQKPHPPALALLMVLGLTGAPSTEWPVIISLITALAIGAFAGHRGVQMIC